jgi:hypothetical protein
VPDILNTRQPWIHPLFWRGLIITSLVFLFATIGLNYFVDPYGIYKSGLFPTSEINYYQNKIQSYKAFDPPPQCLILGSSRVLAMDPQIVERETGRRSFNFAVPGAKAETFYAILRFAIDYNNPPIDTIIVGVDPESFHPTLPIQPESLFIDGISKYYIYDPQAKKTWWDKFTLLLTLEQTSESISSIQRVVKNMAGKPKMEFRPDGMQIWIQLNKQIEEGKFNLQERLDERVIKYPERSLMLSEFTSMSETREKYWQDFISICKEKNIKIYAFLPSEHPQLHELLMSLGAGEIFGEVAEYLDNTVESAGGTFRDYTDITGFDGDPSLFYDEIHMRPENGAKLLENLLRDDE